MMTSKTELARLPLSGLRVLDLSRVLAGPWCSMALGDLGAEVIKVEHPGRGDDTRDWGMRIGSDGTTYFNSTNRNKRSVTLDLSTEKGREVVLRLAQQSDVLVHNFKFGDAEKLGVGYADIFKVRPNIIYCSISGYGTDTQEASRPGYDIVIQGEVGMMSMNGDASDPPLKFGTAVVDMFTGMYASQAILAALYARNETGEGRQIEMALFDSGVMITAFHGLEALFRQHDIPKYGNSHPSIIPYGVFDADDGKIVIAVGNNTQYARFCRLVINRPDLVDDVRFSTNLNRTAHRNILESEIKQEVRKYKRQALLDLMRAEGIPCGEVQGLFGALTSARASESELVQTYPLPDGQKAPVFSPPYRLNGQRPPIRFYPPGLGEGTEDVLKTVLNMSESDIAELRKNDII